MVWKRITNRQNKGKKGNPNHETIATSADLEQYFFDLTPELNFRLLCDRDGKTDPSEQLLWVESITLTAYEPNRQTSKTKNRYTTLLHRLKYVAERIRNRLKKL